MKIFKTTKEKKPSKRKMKKEEKVQKKALKEQEKIESMNKLKAFNPDRTFGKVMFIDTENRQFKTTDISKPGNIYNLDQIEGYEIVENGSSVSSGGLGRAAVGALTFGGAGAIVGAVTGKKKSRTVVENLKIKFKMNNLDTPVVYLQLLSHSVKQNSIIYKDAIILADKILSTLDILLKEDSEKTSTKQNFSASDEIRKFKELLDEEIITQEEFDLKKKELLNL
ncbi:hypothetical protein D920_00189 [Enterococcus faecalis 13-SD-W-01]|nr:hypothetical protein D920_00189 [Enterococcus faecalis 13-SD-W-01]